MVRCYLPKWQHRTCVGLMQKTGGDHLDNGRNCSCFEVLKPRENDYDVALNWLLAAVVERKMRQALELMKCART